MITKEVAVLTLVLSMSYGGSMPSHGYIEHYVFGVPVMTQDPIAAAEDRFQLSYLRSSDANTYRITQRRDSLRRR
jgi:hypothetical protein